MTTKSLEELFYKATPSGLGKYAKIIERYGTSLEETRALVGDLGAALKAREYKFLPTPRFMTEAEAAKYGIELAEPLPADWLLKITPTEGEAPTISFITPDKWEIVGEDEYISPEGKRYTKAELDALMEPPKEPAIPPARQFRMMVEQGLIPEGSRFLGIEGEQIQYIPPGRTEAETTTLSSEDLARIYGEQELYRWTIATQYEAHEAMRAIFGEENIETIINYADTDPEGFVGELLEAGRTEETETILKFFGAAEVEIGEFFGEMPTEIPEIPTEGLTFTLENPNPYTPEAPEPSQEVLVKDDNSVWVGESRVATLDRETGQFIPYQSLWQKVWERIKLFGLGLLQPFKYVGQFNALPFLIKPEEYGETGERIESYWEELREEPSVVERAKRAWPDTFKTILGSGISFALSGLPGGELRKRYDELPWYVQLLAESPAWAVMAAGAPSAGAATKGLIGKGAPWARALRFGLKPGVKIEAGLARIVSPITRRLGIRAYNKWLVKEGVPAYRRWLTSQGVSATPADEAFVRWMTKDTLEKFIAAYTGRQIATTPSLAQRSYGDFIAQYGTRATSLYQSQGMTVNVVREIERYAISKGDKALASAARNLILRFERGGRIEAVGNILMDKLAADFITAYEATGGKITAETGYSAAKWASQQAQEYFPLMYATDMALSGADVATHTIVMSTSQNIMAQGITPASITPQLVESFLAGQKLSMTLGLLQALQAAGFSEEAIQLMGSSEAWANLLKNVTPVPAVISGEPSPPMEVPATFEPIAQPQITEMTIPPTENIIKASIEPNLARTLFRAASNLPSGKSIVGAIDPRALVPHLPETIADAINKNAIAWREIIKIGQGVRAVKMGSLSGITTNAAKMFAFNTNALSTRMINRLLPQYKGTVEAGTLEHVFTHPEMYDWTGFRKGLEYVTQVHKINTEVLNLLRAEGVAPENVTEDWWIHRVVEGKYDANGELIAVRGRPGMRGRFAAKRAFDMHRKAPTMYEGMSWKIKYSEHPEASVSTYIEEAYRKIANARFYTAVDKDLEAIGMAGKLPTELLKEQFPEIFERAEVTAERAKDLGNFHKVISRAVRGEIPPTQTLNAMEKRFPELGRRFRELVQEPATEIKQLRQLLNESQKAIKQLESQLKAKEIKPETITPQVIPDELKLAEAFKIMTYEDRLAFRSTMDDQLEEYAKLINEHEMELGGIREFLKTDPVATYRGHIGKRSVSLMAVLKKGQFPESFTLKEAQLLMMGKTPKTVIEGRVPRSVVVDELADHFKMTEQQLIDHIESIAVQKQTVEDLGRLIGLVDGRLKDIKRMLTILDGVDTKPEFIPQAEAVIPKAEIGMPEAGLQVDMFGYKTPVFPVGKGVVTQISMDEYNKLIELRKAAGLEGLPPNVAIKPAIEGVPLEAPVLPKEIKLYRTTRGFEEDATLRKELEDELGYKLFSSFDKRIDAENIGFNLIKTAHDVRLVKHISTVETGGVTTWEIYSKPVEVRAEFAKITYEMPKIKTVNERKVGLEALRKQVKLLVEGFKPEYWRARFERQFKLESIRQAPGIGKGYIMHPHYGGKIYAQEFVDSVNKFMGHDAGYKVLKFTSNAAGILRVTKAAMDFSFMAIQGLPAIGLAFSYMATDPIKGKKMMAECIKATVYPVRAVFDPEWMYRYLQKYEPEATQRNSFGGSSVAVDMFEKAKLLGGPYPRFELAFFGAGEMPRNLFWKEMIEEAKATHNEFQLARFLDRMTGIISTEAIGVPVTIRQLESSFVWFAPRYTRACLTLLANCFRGGYTGAKARRALGGMIAAGTLMYSVTQYGISKLQGRTNEEAWEDILGGFGVVRDPITKEWAWKPSARMMTFKIGNYNIGIGGFWYGLVRLSGNILACINHVGDKEPIDLLRIMKYGSFNKQDNPFIRWWFSRSSPLNSFMFEAGWPLLKSAFSGELQAGADFFGYPIETWQEYVAYMITRFEPIWMEQGLNPYIPYAARDYEIPEGAARIVVPLVEIFGMRSFPEGGWTIFYDKMNEILAHLPEDILKEYFTEDELVKILEVQEEGKLNWSHLPKPLKQRLLQMYPELKDLYEQSLTDSALRNSPVWKQWEAQRDAERTTYYDYGNSLIDRVGAGEIDTRELRELWSDRGRIYGSAIDTIQDTEFYKQIYDYFEKRREQGVKYDWYLEFALMEYQDILFQDYLDENGDMDWDARDRAVGAYIEEWGEETYEIIRQMYADKKLLEGLSPVLVRLADDKDKLGREYWQLPWKPIIEMDETDVPAQFLALWKQYQTLKTDKAREDYLKIHPDLAKDWRAEFRKTNPETDAMLALWGYGGRLQTKEAYDLVSKWSQELGIPLAQMGLGLPSPTLIDDYFGYIDLVLKFSGNSAEAKLWRYEHPQFTNWAMENWGWEGTVDYKGMEYYRIQTKWRSEQAEYDALEDKDDRAKYLAEHTDFRDDIRRLQAMDYEFPEDLIETYVDWYETPELKKPSDWKEKTGTDLWYEDDWYLQEHSDFYNEMLDRGTWKARDFSKVPTRKVWDLYLEWLKLPLGKVRRDFEAKHRELDLWLHLKFGTQIEKTAAVSTGYYAVPPEKALEEGWELVRSFDKLNLTEFEAIVKKRTASGWRIYDRKIEKFLIGHDVEGNPVYCDQQVVVLKWLNPKTNKFVTRNLIRSVLPCHGAYETVLRKEKGAEAELIPPTSPSPELEHRYTPEEPTPTV